MMGWNWDQMNNWGAGWGWGGHMFWSWPIMMVGGLLVVVLIVWALQAADREQGNTYPPTAIHTGMTTDQRTMTDSAGARVADVRRTPLEIAQERYARGDISRDEYEAIRADLLTS